MTKQDLVEFGNRVKKTRMDFGISVEEFARIIKISPEFLAQVESGKKPADMKFFHNISKYSVVDLDYLLHGVEDTFARQEILKIVNLDDFDDLKRDVGKLITYMRYSPIVKYNILKHFILFAHDNRERIQQDFEKAGLIPEPLA